VVVPYSVGDYNYFSIDYGSAAATTWNTTTTSTYPDNPAPSPKGEESALAWLDRRVNEMRVKL
jgi:hypothetical protein